jgi:hypothetical protein
MKKTVILVLISFIWANIANAQENSMSHKFALGFQLGQYQNDFGFGINLTSPYFAKNKIALRTRVNLMYNEHINSNNETVWTPYSNISLGLLSSGGKIGDYIRLYGEGGVIGLFPSDDFSSESFVIGGYGLFGFEFYMNKNNNYFIEIGGVGTAASADKALYKPIYSNGLLINTGFRIHFK